jgi:glyoxylase-like metal-dependent hydrolase (beta-lactamase superfamily II)
VRIERLVLTSAESNCWLVGSVPAREALVIDPGEDPARVAGRLAELGWRPRLIVITHAHWDHVNACAALASRFGVEVAMHPADADLLRAVPEVTLERSGARGPAPPLVGRSLADGDVVRFGSEQLRVWHTPGHTPGSVCLLGDGVVFSGDTLMAGWVGRTDRPGGDQPAIRASLWDRLLTLPDDTRVYAGHLEVTTIGAERRDNPYLTGKLPLR